MLNEYSFFFLHRMSNACFDLLSDFVLVNVNFSCDFCLLRSIAQRNLYSAWVRTTNLRESVRAKRIELQLQRESMKLATVINRQVMDNVTFAMFSCICLVNAASRNTISVYCT